VTWDDVYGGLFLDLDVATHRFDLRKFLWVQGEALIGTLIVWEQTGARWAAEWFGRIHRYVLARFPLARHGYPLWTLHGDRQVTFEPHTHRVEHFHHPRHLMLNLLALDRMIAAGQPAKPLPAADAGERGRDAARARPPATPEATRSASPRGHSGRSTRAP
jgi:mannose/cellobiose epimerase-like protein (N-acyl-D-glucosamine 2-epimerase family)